MSMTLDGIGSAIGFVDTALGFIGQIKAHALPDAPPEATSNFRVFAGLTRTDDGDRSTGGNAPALAAWGAVGIFLDQSTPGTGEKIKNGDFRDYQIEGRSGAAYLSVVQTGNDGICIHLITGQSSGIGLQYAWTGDIGKFCGAPWYQQANSISLNSVAHIPPCVWIDGNADKGHIWKGFNMHLNSFPLLNDDDVSDALEAVVDAWNLDKDLLCKSEPRFSLYQDIKIGNQARTFITDPTTIMVDKPEYADNVLNPENWSHSEKPPPGKLPIIPNGKVPVIACLGEGDCFPEGPSFDQNLAIQEETGQGLRARSRSPRQTKDDKFRALIRKRQEAHADNLIISNITQHSAAELCDSMTSLGPDFVSMSEMQFCDMSEKQLWPICAGDVSSYCFDMDTQTVLGSNTGLKISDTVLYSKSTSASGVQSLAARQPTVPNKSYVAVDTWG